jgi:hypothetical protein
MMVRSQHSVFWLDRNYKGESYTLTFVLYQEENGDYKITSVKDGVKKVKVVIRGDYHKLQKLHITDLSSIRSIYSYSAYV